MLPGALSIPWYREIVLTQYGPFVRENALLHVTRFSFGPAYGSFTRSSSMTSEADCSWFTVMMGYFENRGALVSIIRPRKAMGYHMSIPSNVRSALVRLVTKDASRRHTSSGRHAISAVLRVVTVTRKAKISVRPRHRS